MPGDVTSPPAGETPRTEAGRELVRLLAVRDIDAQQRIAAIEREAASAAPPEPPATLTGDDLDPDLPGYRHRFAAPEGLDVDRKLLIEWIHAARHGGKPGHVYCEDIADAILGRLNEGRPGTPEPER